jgi:hypothetical protein
MAVATSTTKVSLLQNANNIQPNTIRQTFNISTIAAAGTTQATGTAIGNEQPFVLISNNTAANGVVLPVAAYIGQEITIFPQLVTNAPLVYPPVGGTINNGTANAGVATPARKAAKFICVDRAGLTWVSCGL